MPTAREISVAQTAVRRTGGVRELLEDHYSAALWGLLGAGLVIRICLLATTAGNRFDLDSAALVARALLHAPGHVYALANVHGQPVRWPYLPGYFPVELLVKGLGGLTGIAFARLFRVPTSLADLGIAWLVQDYLGSRGASRQARLAAAALVSLGPSFIAISGVHGQIDAVAILPAVAALSVWERDRPERRAWVAGLLIGIGIAIKTVPGLMVFALLPSARARGEAAKLIAAAAIVPLIAALPEIVAAGTGWMSVLTHYHGGVGLGGLSLLAQPNLPLDWLHVGSYAPNPVSVWLVGHGNVIAVAAIAVVAALLLYWRVEAPLGAVAIWLTVYVFGVNFFMQYMVWGLPFFLMAGYLRNVLCLELLLFAPVLVLYHGTTHAWVVSAFYVAPMLLVWLVLAVALARVGRRIVQRTVRRAYHPRRPA
jgi:uncharacterized membrane protein